jgi:[ribosomal protein S5]-alanine N-acetyltransferase
LANSSLNFESQRLVYERLNRSHAAELEDVLCDPRVYAHVDDGLAPTFAELLESFILREHVPSGERSNETWIDYVVRLKDSRAAIGRVEATVVEDRAEVAYMLGVRFWRQGYGSELLIWLENFYKRSTRLGSFGQL